MRSAHSQANFLQSSPWQLLQQPSGCAEQRGWWYPGPACEYTFKIASDAWQPLVLVFLPT